MKQPVQGDLAVAEFNLAVGILRDTDLSRKIVLRIIPKFPDFSNVACYCFAPFNELVLHKVI